MTYARLAALVPLRSVTRLERAMKRRDLNAAELAALAGTTRQTIANLRLGRTRRAREPLARAIADALRVEPGELFDLPAVAPDDEAAS